MNEPEKLPSNEEVLRKAADPGLVRDLWDLLRTSGKWWLFPFLIAFLIFGLILVLSQSAAAPFIYTLF
jgi:hypothetical protein